jgi:hypothetical protein
MMAAAHMKLSDMQYAVVCFRMCMRTTLTVPPSYRIGSYRNIPFVNGWPGVATLCQTPQTIMWPVWATLAAASDRKGRSAIVSPMTLQYVDMIVDQGYWQLRSTPLWSTSQWQHYLRHRRLEQILASQVRILSESWQSIPSFKLNSSNQS